MSAKQAMNNNFQGTVATYLRSGRVVNNQIKKHLLLSLQVQKNKIGKYLTESYKQESDYLVYFLRLLAVCWPGAQSARANHVLACNSNKLFLICYLKTHHTLNV